MRLVHRCNEEYPGSPFAALRKEPWRLQAGQGTESSQHRSCNSRTQMHTLQHRSSIRLAMRCMHSALHHSCCACFLVSQTKQRESLGHVSACLSGTSPSCTTWQTWHGVWRHLGSWIADKAMQLLVAIACGRAPAETGAQGECMILFRVQRDHTVFSTLWHGHNTVALEI